MKKARQLHNLKGLKSDKLNPSQAWDFLENYAELISGIDQKTEMISLRVPKNILDSFRMKAQKSQLKYQAQIVELMRAWLLEKD